MASSLCGAFGNLQVSRSMTFKSAVGGQQLAAGEWWWRPSSLTWSGLARVRHAARGVALAHALPSPAPLPAAVKPLRSVAAAAFLVEAKQNSLKRQRTSEKSRMYNKSRKSEIATRMKKVGGAAAAPGAGRAVAAAAAGCCRRQSAPSTAADAWSLAIRALDCPT